ncbi:MAG: sigma-70 family RNA polymerase sigma factor [Pseudomonadota bacterium]
MSKPSKNATKDVVVQFYRDHFDRFVYELRAAFGAGPPEPEDIAQQAFEKLLNHDDSENPIRNVKAYLWLTCRNLIISELRRLKATKQRDNEYAEHALHAEGFVLTPERVLDSREQFSLAAETIAAMPPMRKRAFVLVRVNNLSQTEAAKQLGISRTAVSKHLARATQQILAALIDSEEQ